MPNNQSIKDLFSDASGQSLNDESASAKFSVKEKKFTWGGQMPKDFDDEFVDDEEKMEEDEDLDEDEEDLDEKDLDEDSDKEENKDELEDKEPAEADFDTE